MAKPNNQSAAPVSEKTRARVFRVVPHLGPDGKRVPERWDMEEVVVVGVVESRKLHEKSVTLPVARHRHTIELTKWSSRESPETWE